MPLSQLTLDVEAAPRALVTPRLKALARTLLVALGFTTLFFLWIIKPAVESKQDALYHWSGPASSFFLPAALDFLAFWLLLMLLLLAARISGRLRAGIWGGLLFFTPCFVGQTLHALTLIPVTHELDRALFVAAALATLVLVVCWRPAFAPRFDRVVETASTILVFAGLFGVFILSQLAFRGWQARRHMGKFPLNQSLAVTTQPHRIIWIVFDELSYQQTFGRRFPGLQLPAFDALAATATNFTQAQTFDLRTQVVLPGLFTGQTYDDMKTTPAVELSVHNADTGQWQIFDQHNTVFQDALNAGYNTAIAGWYNPYCRIVPAVVDNCYWTMRFPTNLMMPSNSLSENMLAPIKLFGWMLLGVTPGRVYHYAMDRLHIPLATALVRQAQIDDYLDLTARSNALLRDPSYGFVLLHLPVPHPWGIYDRHTGKFISTGPSSYINNLALADKCFAALRQTLEQTGQWDSSTIVVMGDHSWRTEQIWKHWANLWSPEENLASQGAQYDPRPAYLVKLPNQTTSSHIDTPFRIVNSRELFDAILAHKINTPADLSTWAQSTR